ncbi:MAG: malate synthase G, partial [Rhodospirillaceae bacterium]|nr:malate synthase G [Rhodospirillaceae bacterium]MBT6290445.1 malate synthase G [Rhodospirillaceae bacterium]
MSERVQIGGLSVAQVLSNLVADDIAPGTGIDATSFWAALETIIADLGPRNRELLAKRDDLQAKIDAWHLERKGQPHDGDAYKTFLGKIGYLVPEGPDFQVSTENVDSEIAVIAGAQLVVPVTNARFALNAANARWGSLYDALYGTDVISEDDGATRAGAYNPVRGAKVIKYVAEFLDQAVPLAGASHKDASAYAIKDGALVVTLGGGGESGLATPAQFAGYVGDAGAPSSVLLRHHGLHLEIQIDKSDIIGKEHAAGVKDVAMEAAITTIQDLEDSISAVDAED